MADLLSTIEGPFSSDYGTGLYDFGYVPEALPPSGVATTASQVESGGTGINWDFGALTGNLIQDVTKAWVTIQDHKNQTNLPTGYARNAQGQIYAVDPAYRPQPTVGSTLNSIPLSFLMIGGLLFLAVVLGDD